MVGGLRDVITCAKFQIEIFMGYDFTGGRIFDFPIDFSMGLTTVHIVIIHAFITRASSVMMILNQEALYLVRNCIVFDYQ